MKLPCHFGRRTLFSVWFFVTTIMVLAAAAPEGWAKDRIPFELTKIIFEFNATDQDLGIQISLNGDPWREVKIVGPDGRKIFEVKANGSLKKFGLTELFVESFEPELIEFPFEDILALFPAGVYTFLGKGVEGESLVGTATLTHNIPDGPGNLSPAKGAVVNPNNPVMISWNAVQTPLGIVIVGYQVIVERANPSRAFDVKLPAGATFVTIPPEFLEPGTEYKYEVLAIEQGGNQTISSSSFCTSPLAACAP